MNRLGGARHCKPMAAPHPIQQGTLRGSWGSPRLGGFGVSGVLGALNGYECALPYKVDVRRKLETLCIKHPSTSSPRCGSTNAFCKADIPNPKP